MKMRFLVAAAVLAFLVGGAPSALAQQHRGGHHGCAGCGPGCEQDCGSNCGGAGSQTPRYDLDTVTTLQGAVTAVTVVPASGGRSGGVHVTLESATKTGVVHLGPSWFLEKQGLKLAEGDLIEVTGSIVAIDGASALIAREVKKGAKVVTLRDARGVPEWSGGPRR